MGIFDSIQRTGQSFSNTVQAAGNAVAKAGEEFLDDTASRWNGVADSFQNEGLASGVMETLDAVSVGSIVADQLDALGVIPDHGVAKEGMSAVVNFTTGNFAMALKDAFDLVDEAQKSAQNAAVSKPLSPREALARARRNAGYATQSASGIHGCQNAQIIPVRRVVEETIKCELNTRGVVRTGSPVRDTPANERTIESILNDPTLCFEDMVAMVLAMVMRDAQEEMEDALRQFDRGHASTSPFGQNSSAQSTLQAGTEALDNGALDFETMLGGGLEYAGGAMDFAAKAWPVIAPIALPALQAALVAAVPVGPVLAPFLPILVPAALGLGGAALKQGGKMMSQSNRGAEATNQFDAARAMSKGQEQSSNLVPSTANQEDDRWSRSMQMEKIKMMAQRLEQMQSCLSNILNTQHKTAMNAIQNI